jgi:3-polyprenyl-4-hydroxybenzoate decarboxylase
MMGNLHMLDAFYLRHPHLVAYGTDSSFTVFVGVGYKAVFRGEHARRLPDLLDRLIEPTSGRMLLESFGEIGEATLAALLGELTRQHLVLTGDENTLRHRRERLNPTDQQRPCRHLLVGITGAVQAADSISFLEPLFHKFAQDMEIVLTVSALDFVQPKALEYMYGRKPWIDPALPREGVNVPHIHLAHWADLVLILPASARTLHRLASGACSDLLSLVCTATRAPVVVVPSMNEMMWYHPAVRRNVRQIRQDGIIVVSPGYGFEVADRHQEQHKERVVGGVGVSPGTIVELLTGILESA